jgi:hypothetical protein
MLKRPYNVSQTVLFAVLQALLLVMLVQVGRAWETPTRIRISAIKVTSEAWL